MTAYLAPDGLPHDPEFDVDEPRAECEGQLSLLDEARDQAVSAPPRWERCEGGLGLLVGTTGSRRSWACPACHWVGWFTRSDIPPKCSHLIPIDREPRQLTLSARRVGPVVYMRIYDLPIVVVDPEVDQ